MSGSAERDERRSPWTCDVSRLLDRVTGTRIRRVGRPRRRWTAEEDEAFAALLPAGHDPRTLAADFGRTEAAMQIRAYCISRDRQKRKVR